MEDGKVFIPDPPPDEDRRWSATIEAVTAPGEAEPSGYTAAPTLRTEGVIYPGLIDLHSHLAYNWRSLWFPLGGAVHGPEPVAREATYGREISKPAAALGTAAAKAVLKYAEVKALVGGTTAIQGSPA